MGICLDTTRFRRTNGQSCCGFNNLYRMPLSRTNSTTAPQWTKPFCGVVARRIIIQKVTRTSWGLVHHQIDQTKQAGRRVPKQFIPTKTGKSAFGNIPKTISKTYEHHGLPKVDPPVPRSNGRPCMWGRAYCAAQVASAGGGCCAELASSPSKMCWASTCLESAHGSRGKRK